MNGPLPRDLVITAFFTALIIKRCSLKFLAKPLTFFRTLSPAPGIHGSGFTVAEVLDNSILY